MKLFSVLGLSALLAIANADLCKRERDAQPPPTKGMAELGVAPKFDDFLDFFQGDPEVKDKHDKLLFWSGVEDIVVDNKTGAVNPTCSRAVAENKKRYTLNMLIGERWTKFQRHNNSESKWGKIVKDGHWANWPEARANFWIPASRALACFATGEVINYADIKVVDSKTTIWAEKERDIILDRLSSGADNGMGKDKKITKLVFVRREENMSLSSAGEITSTTPKDKISKLTYVPLKDEGLLKTLLDFFSDLPKFSCTNARHHDPKD
jgi:hypothetical protein